MIDTLTKRVTGALRMSFKEFTGEHKENKVNVIVSFLAMLQLVRDGVLHASQNEHFHDITLETKEVGVPRY
jgi:chromatin segregation and condensation protein Rec8/ScpA/Scc1 (kleisin family)